MFAPGLKVEICGVAHPGRAVSEAFGWQLLMEGSAGKSYLNSDERRISSIKGCIHSNQSGYKAPQQWYTGQALA